MRHDSLELRVYGALSGLLKLGHIQTCWLPGMAWRHVTPAGVVLAEDRVKDEADAKRLTLIQRADDPLRLEQSPSFPRYVPALDDDLTVQGLILLARRARAFVGGAEASIVFDHRNRLYIACVFDFDHGADLRIMDAIRGWAAVGATEADCAVQLIEACYLGWSSSKSTGFSVTEAQDG